MVDNEPEEQIKRYKPDKVAKDEYMAESKIDDAALGDEREAGRVGDLFVEENDDFLFCTA